MEIIWDTNAFIKKKSKDFGFTNMQSLTQTIERYQATKPRKSDGIYDMRPELHSNTWGVGCWGLSHVWCKWLGRVVSPLQTGDWG